MYIKTVYYTYIKYMYLRRAARKVGNHEKDKKTDLCGIRH